MAEHGATRARNAGQETEYQNVKPGALAKGVNLKDYVFSREFIEKTGAEKRRFLADEGRRQYESQLQARAADPEFAARLTEWHTVWLRRPLIQKPSGMLKRASVNTPVRPVTIPFPRIGDGSAPLVAKAR